MSKLNGEEFAKKCEVHKSSIGRARDRGELNINNDGTYDTEDKINAAYILKQLARQETKLQKRQKSKAIIREKSKPKPSTPKPQAVRQAARSSSNLTKIEADIMLKEVQIKRAELDYAITLGSIVPREEIQHLWNKLLKSRSYFSDFGQRYASVWAASLGVSDSKLISKLEKEINKATEKFFNDFCDQIEGEL